MQKVTLPFPAYDFRIECGKNPAVLQWLYENSINFPADVYSDIRNYVYYDDVSIRVGTKRAFTTSRVNQHLPLLTEDMLFGQLLSVEEVLAMFLKKHRKFTAAKKIASLYAISMSTRYDISTFINNLPLYTKWKKVSKKFNLSDTIDVQKFLSIK